MGPLIYFNIFLITFEKALQNWGGGGINKRKKRNSDDKTTQIIIKCWLKISIWNYVNWECLLKWYILIMCCSTRKTRY